MINSGPKANAAPKPNLAGPTQEVQPSAMSRLQPLDMGATWLKAACLLRKINPTYQQVGDAVLGP